MKKEITVKHENDVRVSDLATQKKSICTNFTNKETIKGADVARDVTVLTKQRSQMIEAVEKLLPVWIKKKLLASW